MNARAVGLQVLVQLRVLVAVPRVPARARDAGLRVDHDSAGNPFAELPEQRLERQGRSGRVAAGIGDQPRSGHGRPVPLRQPVDGFRENVRRRVLAAVPAPVRGRIPEPEVRADVDDPSPGLKQPARRLERLAVRQGQEHDVGRVRQAIPVRLHQVGVDGGAQVRKDVAGGTARLAARRQRAELHFRMAVQPPDEFRSTVAGRPGDRSPNHKTANSTPLWRKVIRRPASPPNPPPKPSPTPRPAPAATCTELASGGLHGRTGVLRSGSRHAIFRRVPRGDLPADQTNQERIESGTASSDTTSSAMAIRTWPGRSSVLGP